MQIKYLLILPCFIFCAVATFFVGIKLNSTSEVSAADTTITFTCTSGGTIIYAAESGNNSIYPTQTAYNNPDYCSKVIITIRNTSNTILASDIVTISGAANTNGFTITGPFVAGTWYRLEASTPTFGVITFTMPSGTNYLNSRHGGYFVYTANLAINYTYTVSEDTWFTTVVTT